MQSPLKQGILVIAQGKQRYIHMAKQIAISLRLSNPHISIALVTDSSDPELKQLYDHLIPVKAELGTGFIQKIGMYDYSPYQQTLFIDVDCIVVRNIDFLFGLFKGNAVAVMGKKVFEGKLFGAGIQKIKEATGAEYLISFNGGVYYFEKGETAQKVYNTAKHYINKYEELGFDHLRGNRNEEPIMSLAMSVCGMSPVDDKGKGMYTPVGQSGVFKMDALKGYCEFYKYGNKVTPAIMHFGGGYPEAFHYRRESLKLRLVHYYKVPRLISSFIVNASWNPVYASYVLGYRIIKKAVKGGKLKITPLMPMFRFE